MAFTETINGYGKGYTNLGYIVHNRANSRRIHIYQSSNFSMDPDPGGKILMKKKMQVNK